MTWITDLLFFDFFRTVTDDEIAEEDVEEEKYTIVDERVAYRVSYVSGDSDVFEAHEIDRRGSLIDFKLISEVHSIVPGDNGYVEVSDVEYELDGMVVADNVTSIDCVARVEESFVDVPARDA